jgi:hypothetical protein
VEEWVQRAFLVSGLDAKLVKKAFDLASGKGSPSIVQDHGNKDEFATAQRRKYGGKGGARSPPEGESTLFGLTDPALKELIRSASEYGYVTYDQVDALLSRDDIRSEQIEDIWRKLARWVWA